MKPSRFVEWMIALACLLAAAGCENGVEPTIGVWQRVGLDGKEINALKATPWGVFAATRTYGIFRHTGHGWEEAGLQDRTVTSLLYVDTPTPYLLAGLLPEIHTPADATTYFTTDGARTWVPRDGRPVSAVRTDPGMLVVRSDPDDSERLVAGTHERVLLSEDGGASWHASYDAGTGGFGPVFREVATHGGRVWARGYGALGERLALRSDDWGGTWEAESDHQFFPLGASTNPDRLWGNSRRSFGYRSGTAQTFMPVLEYSVERGTISTVDARGDTLCARSYAYLFCTTDDARSWRQIELPAEATGPGAILVESPEGIMIGSSGGGVWLLRSF
jgi:hypothetical protein